MDSSPIWQSTEQRSGIEEHVNRIRWTDNGKPLLRFVGDHKEIPIGNIINSKIKITIKDSIKCTVCGEESEVNPCSECDGTAPTAKCVYRPGRFCTYYDCPFQDFKRRSCSQNFVVYLVAKSKVKVGITRRKRVLNRWYEQGATHGMVLADAPNRKVAGLIERSISQDVSNRSTKGLYKLMDKPQKQMMNTVEKLLDTQDTEVNGYFRDNVNNTNCIDNLRYPTKDNYLAIEEDGRSWITEDKSREINVVGIQGQNIVSKEHIINISHISGRKINMMRVN